jgi:hypothetical protein
MVLCTEALITLLIPVRSATVLADKVRTTVIGSARPSSCNKRQKINSHETCKEKIDMKKTNHQNRRSVPSLTLEKPDQTWTERQLNVGGSS